MKRMKRFFECFFYVMKNGLCDLDITIEMYRNDMTKDNLEQLKLELKDIIENNKYEKASYFLKKEAHVRFSFGKTELILKYIYAKLCNQSTEITLDELIKRLRK